VNVRGHFKWVIVSFEVQCTHENRTHETCKSTCKSDTSDEYHDQSPVTSITTLEHAKLDYILPKTSDALQKSASCIIHARTPTATARGSKRTGPVPRGPPSHQNLLQRVRAARASPPLLAPATPPAQRTRNPKRGRYRMKTISPVVMVPPHDAGTPPPLVYQEG
jgi:hypothetical protein